MVMAMAYLVLPVGALAAECGDGQKPCGDICISQACYCAANPDGTPLELCCAVGQVPCGNMCMDTSCVCLLEPLPGGQNMLCPADTTFGGSLFFQYLNVGGMFSWGLGLGAALAILNVTIGGFQIMTGGADPAAVEAGKVRIFGSILGLIFLMFAGVILNFINPLFFSPI